LINIFIDLSLPVGDDGQQISQGANSELGEAILLSAAAVLAVWFPLLLGKLPFGKNT